MDPSFVEEFWRLFLSTEEGAAMGQAIQQMMPQFHDPESTLTEAGEQLLSCEFTPEECKAFEESVKRSLGQADSDFNRNVLEKQAIIFICNRLESAFAEGCNIFQAFHFFYRVLSLLEGACHLDGSRPGEEIMVNTACHTYAVHLWKTLFIETNEWQRNEKTTLTLLKDLRELAFTNVKNNPAFGYYVIQDLRRAYQQMRKSFTTQEFNNINADLVFLLAKCTYQAEQYKLATIFCKQASDLYACSRYIVYELWAMALHKSGQLQAAISQLDFAKGCVQDERIQRHLQKYMDEIRQDMLTVSHQSSSVADDDWLADTNIRTTQVQKAQAQQIKNAHVKKKRHSRPKREPVEQIQVSPDDWLKGTPTKKKAVGDLTHDQTKHSDPRHLTADNNPLLQYTEWDTSSGDDGSDLEDAIKMPMPQQEEREPEVTKVKCEATDKTWFEESKEMYDNGQEDTQIVCGMLMDVNTECFEIKQNTRAPFYRPTEPVWQLQQWMASMPYKYKACKIEFESCHKAVCKLVLSDEKYSEIEIHGRSKCGHETFNQDEVCVEILSQPKSHPAPTYMLTKRTEEDNKVYGRVVGVLKTNFRKDEHPVIACTCDDEEGFLLHPLCKSVPKIHTLNSRTMKKYPSLSKYRIDTYRIDENGSLQFKRYFDVKPGLRGKYVFLVVYLTWGIQHVYPLGAVIDILECGSDFNGGLSVLEMQYQVPRYFSKKTVEHINKMLEQKQNVLTDGRVDCTGLTVFTIDPSHSKDLDDALSVSKKDDHFLVGVHIADVASVVKKGDPVDQEAKKRATSYYPGDSRVHHMLPEPLSENFCSLLPNEERPTLSIFFHIEKSGKLVKEPSVMKTVIRSCRKVSYEETQNIINEEEIDGIPEDVTDSIQLLHEISQNLRKKRMKDSRFAVPFEDTRFLDSGNIEETVEAHALVEEFMIKANTSIAHWLKKKFPDCIPIRCQSEPPKEDLQKFAQTEEKFLDIVVDLQGREILPARKVAAENWVAKRNTVRKEPLPIQRNIWLQILEGVHDDKMKEAMKIMCKDEVHPFQAIALQHWRGIMETAEYKCSVEPEKEHYSLNTKMYTHFTSPIRRYIDLIVHRLVHAALDGNPCPYTAEDISEVCVYINDATARQKHFSNGCKALKRAEKMSQRPMVFHAFVKNVTDSGAELCIPSLKHISGKSRELPFNLMDFCKKPEESHDALSGKTIVWGKWKKRLYDCTGCPSQLMHSQALDRQKQRPKHVVDPHQYVYFVDTQTWAKMLKALFSKEHKTVKKILNTQSPEGQDLPRGPQVRDIVTSEFGDGSVKFHQCKFEFCFAPGRVIKVQMVAEPASGLLTPQVRLFHVCKNLSLCLSHMEDPVGVLSRYATESTKKNIESVAEYQRTWLPLLEMEAATSAVRSEENVIINNVSLEFQEKAGKTRTFYSGKFTLPSKFINDRCIEFGGKSLEKLKEEGDEDDEKDSSGRRELSSVDYLCIRCQIQQSKTEPVKTFKEPASKKVVEVPCPLKGDKKRGRSDRGTSSERSNSKKKVVEVEFPMKARRVEDNPAPGTSCTDEDPYTWVGHGQVVKVRRRKRKDMDSDSVTVSFNINANSPAVPDCLIPAAIGTVEVIFKSEVDRRTMRMVQNLTSDKLNLATCIALHRKAPKLDKDRMDYGKKMEKEVPIRELPANNKKQHDAIERALTSSFSLIQGPPGTGKTYTGIKLVYLFDKINKFLHLEGVDNQKKQVLFCGPSNKAVDLVARLLLQRLGEMCPKIIRLYGSNIVSQDYPVPKRNFMSKRSIRDLKSDPNLYNVSLHHMIRQSGKPNADEIKSFDALFRKHPDAVTPNHIKKYSKLVYTASCEELKKCDVILCTCAVGGNRKLIQSTRIYQCIIDECAMSPEPQTMVPIIATKAKQVVLIGDHKQLRPIVQCKEAAELGLDQSLFERFAAQAIFLNIQYRMNPRLCDFPSETFYAGKLETGPSVAWEKLQPWEPLKLWPVKEVPHVLCHVEGVEEILSVSTEEGNEQSRSNKAEIDKVVEIFSWLVEKEKVKPRFINVISQYNAQCSKIREVLGRYHQNVNVNTVVASQGGEWDYVIFSTVRSLPDYKIEKHPTLGWSKHNLGFITDANQINVALTRAHKGLIIIGNQNLLRSDVIFKSLIEKYEKQGCTVDGSEFPRRFRRDQPRRRTQIPGANWQNV